MRSSSSINQLSNNLQSSQLKASTAPPAEDEKYFDQSIRNYYDECKNCPMRKYLDHVCLSAKCENYFKLVCPYCHRLSHKIDVTMTYQIQDIDLFMQEIVKMAKQKKAQTKKQREKNQLFDIIDQKIKDIDSLVQTIESIKNVLMYKKVVLGQVFQDYDLVYEELIKLYKPSNRQLKIDKSLDFLNKMFHYKKGANGMWQLQWKNDTFVQENFFKPLQELDTVKTTTQGSQKRIINTIKEQDEDLGSNESGDYSRTEQKYQEKFNQAIDSIQNTLNLLTTHTNNFIKSEDFVYLSSIGTVEDHIKNEKQKCLTECNKILKEFDIHFQWETFDQIQSKETSISAIVSRFSTIFLTRAYHEEEGDEIPIPNLERLFAIYLNAKEKINNFEQFHSKNFVLPKRRF